MATLTCGAVWYSGAGDRYTMSSRKRQSAAIPSTPMLLSEGWMSYIGRRIPLGCPVVPDEYIIGAPSCSPSTLSVRWVPTASSHDSKGPAGSPTMIQRSTFGQSAGSCRATSALAAEVTTTRDSESLTM